MAVLKLKAKEMADDYRGAPINDHGKMRVQFFELEATEEAGDANTTIDLTDLPGGEIRILPHLCKLEASAFGAGRTLDIGLREYQNRDDPEEDLIAEDQDTLADGLDVSSATSNLAFGTALKHDVYAKDRPVVFAKVLGGTIPAGATIKGYLVYIHE